MMGVVAGMVALSSLARGGSAVSWEATLSRRAFDGVMRATESSHALFGRKAAALAALHAVGRECSVEGWDGDGAVGVSPLALQRAADVIRAMPDGLVLPEFAAEPDGAVSLEWAVARHRRFMMSVGEGDRIAFAWVDGTDRGHGVARFDGFTIPSRVLGALESIVLHDGATFRFA
jgi:hypothetical protein